LDARVKERKDFQGLLKNLDGPGQVRELQEKMRFPTGLRPDPKLCRTPLSTMFAYLVSRQYILGLNLNSRDYRKVIDYRRVVAQENSVVAHIRKLWCEKNPRSGCKRRRFGKEKGAITDFFC
jgi:hypothetical protein